VKGTSQFLNQGAKNFISTQLQPGVNDGQNAKPVLTGFPGAEKLLKQPNFLFSTITWLKPGANERYMKIKIYPCEFP
jgi:hypothetical protein